MRRRAWWLYLGGMAAVSAAYMFGPQAIHAGPVFNALGASAAIAVVIGSRINRPGARLPWYLLALGQALFVAGDIVAYNYERFFGGEIPYPSLADGLYLSVYPSLIAGLLILIHRRNPARDRASLVDALIVATGAGALSWVFLIAPNAHDASLGLATKLTSVAYPAMDLLLLAVVARLAMGAGRRETSFTLLVGGALALFITDSIFGWLLLHGGYEPGGVLDGGWLLFYGLLGTAALHPSMQRLSEPAPPPDFRLTPRRLALLAGATLIAPAVQIALTLNGGTFDETMLAGASVVLFSLVVIRMAGLVTQHQKTVAREKALREAGAALVAATSREGIHAAAMEAAHSLVGDDHAAGLQLLPKAQTALAALDPEARAGLSRGVPVELDGVFLAPLSIRDELRGILSVSGEAALPRATRDALAALTSEVALALESASLTEDLLRQESEARFRTLFQHSSDVVAVVGADTTIMYLSPSVESLFRHRVEDLEGNRFDGLVHSEDITRVLAFLSGAINEPPGHSGLIEFRVRHRDGTWLHVETVVTNLLGDPNVNGLVLNMRDMSERKAFEEQLTHQAFHDALTGLPNRALFRNRVEHALERQSRGGPTLAVLFMDLDDFKTINDSLGHAAGDALLRQVGERLQRCVRGADTAARLGGDEFAVLVDGIEDDLGVADIADRMIEALAASFAVEGKEIFMHASIGIAFGDADGRGAIGAEELLRNADVAMYMAKEQGKGRYQVFDPGLHTAAVERLELKADLERAVRDREFVLHYQPIIELQTGEMSGVEALVRWQHPERGLLPPGEFISLAEDTGLIVPIGAQVLEEACCEAAELQRRCPRERPLTMSVNLSVRQLHRADVAATVRKALETSGLDPSSLVLEITESAMMSDADIAALRLQELHGLGVRLAIDDFGTGYSSLNYVRRFPFDILKIDKSFIDDLGEEGEVSALTAAIIGLAGILDLDPVAEGIERPDQLQRLLELECRSGQGFLFSKPLTQADVERLADEQHSAIAR